MEIGRILMNALSQRNIENFCLHIKKSYSKNDLYTGKYKFYFKSIDIIDLTWEFIDFFKIEYPLSIEQLKKICNNSNYKVVGTLSDKHKPRGYHFLIEKEGIICFKENDAPSGQIYTIIHELYEIIEYKLLSYSIDKGETGKDETESKANQFAALVYAPDEAVALWIYEYGLDVFGLKDGLKCSYATALIRIHEVLLKFPEITSGKHLPIISILFESPYWNKKNNEKTPLPQLKIYKKNRGFFFKLRHNEIKELLFNSKGGTYLSILKILYLSYSSGYDVLLKNIEMKFKKNKLTVDILIRNVKWGNYFYPVKILIQLVPSKQKELKELAKKLHIASID